MNWYRIRWNNYFLSRASTWTLDESRAEVFCTKRALNGTIAEYLKDHPAFTADMLEIVEYTVEETTSYSVAGC